MKKPGRWTMAYNCRIDFSKSFLVVTFLVLFTIAMLSVYHAVEKYFLKQTTTTYSKISPKVSLIYSWFFTLLKNPYRMEELFFHLWQYAIPMVSNLLKWKKCKWLNFDWQKIKVSNCGQRNYLTFLSF